ncbi:NUDIX hydrolase [Arachidicoccus terrestris]|uniref:NUDIX hydrolase n=1 Tax=Arachidicoccus terrestris TaxID=2875539 RepID=UPI001CC656FA|nr:NUDIX domain-containing protein [Arachidicoccus terrestris]UAY55061.1 NUDIX domain-containing protein [Arachidicoccus terrestris]
MSKVNASIPIKLHTAGLIVIKDNQLLLAYSNNKKAWYLPGGKIDPGETALESLIREIEEELHVRLNKTDLSAYYHISAPAFGESNSVLMEQDCFIGPASDHYKASGEVGAIRYFSYDAYISQQPVVPGVINAFKKLMADGLIINAIKA